MIKRISLLRRKPHISKEEFARHWRDVHGPLVDHVPGVRGYVQNHVLDVAASHPLLPGDGGSVDGIVEMWFDGEDAMRRALASPEAKAMFADGALFLESVTTYLVDEQTLISVTRG